MAVDLRAREAEALVDRRAELELLADGFVFTEGSIWVPDGAGYLLFSDVPANRRLRWDERDGCREVARATGLADGMTIDRAGRLLVCEGEHGRVTRMSPDGDGSGAEVLADSYDARLLNSPNDVIVGSDGAIYFTDPWWLDMLGCSITRELDFQGVFRIVPGGTLELLIDDMDFPNGLCLSPDERLLYVNDSTPGRISVFDMGSRGRLSGRRTLIEGVRDDSGHVDGMKCDAAGNVWVTGPGGVWVLDPHGALLAVVQTPERAGNLNWGGPERRWLFIAATSGLFRLVTRVGGPPAG